MLDCISLAHLFHVFAQVPVISEVACTFEYLSDTRDAGSSNMDTEIAYE